MVALAICATGALVVPWLTMRPAEVAATEPSGPVFEARRLARERLSPRNHRLAYLVEPAKAGDNLLGRAALRALRRSVAALRAHPRVGPRLGRAPHPRSRLTIHGASSIADAVEAQLRLGGAGGLAGASEAQVAATVDRLLSQAGPSAFALPATTRRDPRSGRWVARGMVVAVLADREALGGGELVTLGGGATLRIERYGREVLEVLRSEARLRWWGIAIDAGLTAREQGRAAGPFIGLTVFAVLALVGLTFRSYWAVALSGFALGALIVWLKGLSYLIGLKDDQILSTIVPIAMISFGVDFAFHGIGRYREQRRAGDPAALAARVGVGGALAALAVAAASDGAAFLANTTTGIEALVQFGVAAALATLASLLLLGVLTPLVLSWIEGSLPPWRPSRLGWIAGTGGVVLAALAAMATVVLGVFVLPWAGAAALAGYGLALIGLPWLACRLVGHRRSSIVAASSAPPAGSDWTWLGRLVVGVARRRRVILPLALGLTAGAAALAVRVEPRFDVRDFFAADTEFVSGLERFERLIGPSSGEPALVYVEGALERPAAREALDAFVARLGATSLPHVARDSAGRLVVERGPRWRASKGELAATKITLRLTSTRDQRKVAATRAALAPALAALRRELRSRDPSARVILTGRPIARQQTLEAILAALRASLPVALALCLVIAAAFMRSLRHAAVSIVPILLVVAWLYALMYLADFGINVVTATIGAISIGVGIDFAVHLTMRFREELARGSDRWRALEAAGAGTGGALLASAASSVVGFSILALAPMPMFASYGLLTAVMIALAAAASLLVLPSLLLLVTPGPR